MAGGPLQAADDMVRILANGLTFGLADKIAGATGYEQDPAAKTMAARNRAGAAGDVANVGAELYGGKALIGGGLKLGKAAIAPVAKAVFSKKGAFGLASALGGLAEYGSRTATPAQAAQAPAPAARSTAKTPRTFAAADSAAGNIMDSLNAVDNNPPTFADMASQVAAAQGGKISMHQLSSLGEVAQRIAPRATKTPAPGDAAAHILEQGYIAQLQKSLADPNADAAAAQKEFEEKVLQLRKTQLIDPYGLSGGGDDQ